MEYHVILDNLNLLCDSQLSLLKMSALDHQVFNQVCYCTPVSHT
jgi:hypothetical protein